MTDRLYCEIITDYATYQYGSVTNANITVRVYGDNNSPVTNCTIVDNWDNSYTNNGDGTYTTTLDVSNLPIGSYQIFTKVTSSNKSNISNKWTANVFVYFPHDYPNQEFKLGYPLFEDLEVYINGSQITSFSTSLNTFGECILNISQTLQEGDEIRVRYKPYTSSTIFYIGQAFVISCTRVDNNSIEKFGQTPVFKICTPFLTSQEEACDIAQLFLTYYAWPTSIYVTDNKWQSW